MRPAPEKLLTSPNGSKDITPYKIAKLHIKPFRRYAGESWTFGTPCIILVKWLV